MDTIRKCTREIAMHLNELIMLTDAGSSAVTTFARVINIAL